MIVNTDRMDLVLLGKLETSVALQWHYYKQGSCAHCYLEGSQILLPGTLTPSMTHTTGHQPFEV